MKFTIKLKLKRCLWFAEFFKRQKKRYFSLFAVAVVFYLLLSVCVNSNYNANYNNIFFLSQNVSENKTAEPASSFVVYFSGSAPRLQFRQQSNPRCESVLPLLMPHDSCIDVQPLWHFYSNSCFAHSLALPITKHGVCLTRSTSSETESKRCARERDARCDSWMNVRVDGKRKPNEWIEQTEASVYMDNNWMGNGRVRGRSDVDATFCVALNQSAENQLT